MLNKAWVEYCVQFHTYQDYFECHEILEEHWKENLNKSKTDIWVGFIALAVSLYHQRNKNYAGAKKLVTMANSIFNERKDELQTLFIKEELFFSQMEELTEKITNELSFQPIALPFKDEFINYLSANEDFIHNQILIDDNFIKNKHTLRDRTEVIAARQESLQRKRTKG